LAEDGEALVSGEGDFVVAVRAAAVVDPAVGAFDHPAAWLDDEAVAGFGAGHDVDVD
jgi:ABC-type arginine transport system ATPase subunit